MPEKEYRRIAGGQLSRDIPIVRRLPADVEQARARLQAAIATSPDEWSHPQVAVRDLNLESLGFSPTRLAIPLPGERIGTTSWRSGDMHAHKQGPVYLVHQDESSPGSILGVLQHAVTDVPPAVVKRLKMREPFAKEAGVRGVYKGEPSPTDSVKFKVDFQGLPIQVERPRGFIMLGVDANGKHWSRRYKYDYGHIPRTLGGDNDGLDVFLGPKKNSKHAFWAVQKKPDGSFDEYKCLLPGQDLQGTVVGGSKALYTGQAVKLRSASGKVLAVTPNHPVLTLRGLIPAGEVKEGDYLLTEVGEGKGPGAGDYNQNPPTVVEKVFCSLVELHPLGVLRKLVTPLDFHGDAGGFEGEVEVVRTYRQLGGDDIPQAAQSVEESDLVRALPAQGDLMGRCTLHAALQAEYTPGVGASSPVTPAPSMLSLNLRGESGVAKAYRFGEFSDVDMALLKAEVDHADVDPEALSDITRCLPSGVAPDQVVNVELVHYSGPVFDFETVSGLMLANQVIVSNCFLGFDNRDEAIAAYRAHIPKSLLAGMMTMRVEMMHAMLGKNPEQHLKVAGYRAMLHELLKEASR